jgi:hypothetical protein
MLLIFLSITELGSSAARTALSPRVAGLDVAVPSMRPPAAPPAGLPALPTVVEPVDAFPVVAEDPDELAVPAEFVPGTSVDFAALPAPLGSFAELLRPPALAGPLGTPLTPDVPAPAEPALGVPTGEAEPVDEPLAAPAAEPPPPAVPPLWAITGTGESSIAAMMSLQGNEDDIGYSLLMKTPLQTPCSTPQE